MKAVLLTFLLLLQVPGAEAQGRNESDGTWWQQLPSLSRLSYVTGFVDGNTGIGSACHMMLSTKQEDASPSEKALLKAQLGYVDDRTAYYGMRMGQLVDGLNEFYKDFRNTRVEVPRAIGYVKDEIRGSDRQTLEKELVSLRREAVSNQ